jgi:CheY-like chemotaxis protein
MLFDVPSASRKYGGLGVGLVYSQKLAWQMGGDVSVVTEQGKGSTFTIWLELEASETFVSGSLSNTMSAILSGSFTDVQSSEGEQNKMHRTWSVLQNVERSLKQFRRAANASQIMVDSSSALSHGEASLSHPGPIWELPPSPAVVSRGLPVAKKPSFQSDLSSRLSEGTMYSFGSNNEKQATPPPHVVSNHLHVKKAASTARSGSTSNAGLMSIVSETTKNNSQDELGGFSRQPSITSGPVNVERRNSTMHRRSASYKMKHIDHDVQFDVVLLAEDNLINQRIGVKLLKQFSRAVIVANNGLDAVDAVRKRLIESEQDENEQQERCFAPFDVIFMDLEMPEMGGIDATKAIRELVTADKMPIVACTAYCMESIRKQCQEAGMQGFIEKPFKAEDIRKAIGKLHRSEM